LFYSLIRLGKNGQVSICIAFLSSKCPLCGYARKGLLVAGYCLMPIELHLLGSFVPIPTWWYLHWRCLFSGHKPASRFRLAISK